jgi:transcriptional regulator with XRE-family HTH domain
MIGDRVIPSRPWHRVSRECVAARLRTNLLQEDVAARMGTTKAVISRLENAVGHRPSLATMEKYAEAVGCHLLIRLVPKVSFEELLALCGEDVGESNELRD